MTDQDMKGRIDRTRYRGYTDLLGIRRNSHTCGNGHRNDPGDHADDDFGHDYLPHALPMFSRNLLPDRRH
jgi:hypothetical protein